MGYLLNVARERLPSRTRDSCRRGRPAPETVQFPLSRALNVKSERVMRRLGMTHNPSDDFDVPWYSLGHPALWGVCPVLENPPWNNGSVS